MPHDYLPRLASTGAALLPFTPAALVAALEQHYPAIARALADRVEAGDVDAGDVEGLAWAAVDIYCDDAAGEAPTVRSWPRPPTRSWARPSARAPMRARSGSSGWPA